MVVGRRRKRNQDRRPSRRRQLRERRRTGAADHQIRCGHFTGNGVEERLRARGYSGALVPLADRCQISLAGLMDHFQAWEAPHQPRRCRHHGHVDRVRALGAAKD